MTEAQIEHQIRKVLGAKEDLVLWRNSTGKMKHDKRFVTYGLCPGGADLIGILGPYGKFFALEIKTPRGKLSDKQLMFQKLIRSLGGFCDVARSVEEALAAYEKAKALMRGNNV
jgi:hypothetical protein